MLIEYLKRSHSSRCIARSLLRIRAGVNFSQTRWGSTFSEPTEPTVSDTHRAEASQKRFWKDVGIETLHNHLSVTLDGRPLRTPAGQLLLLPTSKILAATLIAAEWDHQETVLKPHALPMTSIASRVIDAMQDEDTSSQVRKSLLKYLDTDTVCFFHDNPEPLVRLQSEHWTPLLDWTQKTFHIKINMCDSILFSEQPEETKKQLSIALDSLNKWELAALERATYASKSLIIGLSLVKGHLTVERAALAATVEVDSQIERWGEVEDTHDVDSLDIRRQLGSAACLLAIA